MGGWLRAIPFSRYLNQSLLLQSLVANRLVENSFLYGSVSASVGESYKAHRRQNRSEHALCKQRLCALYPVCHGNDVASVTSNKHVEQIPFPAKQDASTREHEVRERCKGLITILIVVK